MYHFTLSLAGIAVGVTALHPTTERYCEHYLTENEPQFSITLTQAMIDFERQRSEEEDVRGGVSKREFTDAYLETVALYRALSVPLLEYDTIVFHGSAVAVGDKAFLFTAPSGTGKTTHTRLWLSQIPGAHVLNGDKPLLRFLDGKVYACGTPWQGKEDYGCNEMLPLAAICFLHRAAENHIAPLSQEQAFSPLLQQIYIPEQTQALVKILTLSDRLGKNVRVYRLDCNMEPEAAWVSWRGMNHDV